MSHVLVEYGKHGDFHWDATTDEKMYNAALAILKDRYEQGHYYDEPEREPEWTGPSVEEIKGLKEIDSDAYMVVASKYKTWQQTVRRCREELRQWQFLQSILKNNDGKGALSFLFDRNDHEYERIELESLSTADSEGNAIHG